MMQVLVAGLQGNLVSDFGFGQRKADALKVVSSFQPTYWLKQMRVAGDELRVLKKYPGKWQVSPGCLDKMANLLHPAWQLSRNINITWLV
jgi:hypothetical protein